MDGYGLRGNKSGNVVDNSSTNEKDISQKNKGKEGGAIEKEDKNTLKTRERKARAMREASPMCDYERIRAANIAERMEVFRMLDIDRAVLGAKE